LSDKVANQGSLPKRCIIVETVTNGLTAGQLALARCFVHIEDGRYMKLEKMGVSGKYVPPGLQGILGIFGKLYRAMSKTGPILALT
jgi:hypothetical protein